MPMNKLLVSRRGTSLIEVLVVMVVLLVGILTIVQMFPAGFGVVKAAESETIATKLAQAEVERWQNMPENLPDGILPIIDDTVQNDQNPGPIFYLFKVDNTTGDYEKDSSGDYIPDNVLNIRQVVGETTTIPIASYFETGGGTAYGSRYALAFAPIDVKLNSQNTYDGLKVKSGDMGRVVSDSNDYPPSLKLGRYAVNYDIIQVGNKPAFRIAVPDTDDSHIYYVSYSYWASEKGASDWTLYSALDQEVNPDPDGKWIDVVIDPPSGCTVEEMEERTDTCARGFVQVSSWSGPYEFTLADSILGVIAFSPYARNTTEYTAAGKKPIIARIDYKIYDPRIIREDRVVPSPNEYVSEDSNNNSNNNNDNNYTAIKLALRFILNAGDFNPNNTSTLHDGDPTDCPDEPTFEGLVRKKLGHVVSDPSDVVVSQSMLIIDLATGLRVDMTNVQIDFATGTVHLPETANLIDWNGKTGTGSSRSDTTDVKLQGRHLRFFYRADGDWSLQCQKAYTAYQRQWGTTAVDYRHFRFRTTTENSETVYQLLFARCETGKSVTVDYTYVTDGVEHRVVGQNYRISDDTLSGTNYSNCCYIDLSVPDGGEILDNSRITVTGTSFKARVIWRDGKAWRHADIDTNLTRRSSMQ